MKKKKNHNRLEINVILCLLFDIISESVLENYFGLLVFLIKCLAKQRFVTGLDNTPPVQRCTITSLWLAILPVRPPTFSHFLLHGGWGNTTQHMRSEENVNGLLFYYVGSRNWTQVIRLGEERCLYPLDLLAGPRPQFSKRLHQMPT